MAIHLKNIDKLFTSNNTEIDLENLNTTVQTVASSGGGTTANFVASGTISTGDTVVLKSDGTVEVASGSHVTRSASQNARVQLGGNNRNTSYHDAIYIPERQLVVVGFLDGDNNSFGTTLIGSVDSSGSITFGSSEVFNSSTTYNIKMIYDKSSEKLLIAYYSQGYNSNHIKVFTIQPNNTLSQTDDWQLGSGWAMNHNCWVYDENAQVPVHIANNNTGNRLNVRGIQVDPSTGKIATGMPAADLNYASGSMNYLHAAYHPLAKKTAIIANNANTSSMDIGFVSFDPATRLPDSTVQLASFTGTQSLMFNHIAIIYSPKLDKLVAIDSAHGLRAFAISVDKIGNGYSVDVSSVTPSTTIKGQHPSLTYDSMTGDIILTYRDTLSADQEMAYTKISVYENSIVTTPQVRLNNTGSNDHYISATYDTDTNFHIAFCREYYASDYKFKVVTFKPAGDEVTSNIDSYIGIASESKLNGENISISMLGVATTNRTDLEASSEYYIQLDGTLGLSKTSVIGDLPKAGLALNSTQIKMA